MFGLFKISTNMNRRMCHILMTTLLLWSSVCIISKPFLPFGAANQQADQTRGIQDTPRPVFDSSQGNERILKEKAKGYKEAFRGLSKLGSTPPRCEHKCGGCMPCDPIQIPTNNDLLGVQYANYEPEGWKCKCGNSYFSP